MRGYLTTQRAHARGARWFNRLAVLALVLEAGLLLCVTASAHADAPAVATQAVEYQTSFSSTRTYSGMAMAARASELGFKQAGQIALVAVDIGDRVAAGDVLAQLDTASLQASHAARQADVAVARARLAAAASDVELGVQTEARVRNLRARGHASEQTHDEVRLALQSQRAQLAVARAAINSAAAMARASAIALAEAQLIAPFAGFVQSRYLDEGTQVGPGQAVLRLVASEVVEAHIGVPARTAAALAPDASYQIRWQDTRHSARLKALAPEIDPTTRTRTAVFELPGVAVPIGAVVELEFASKVEAAGFWVPLAALTQGDRGLWGVYVVNERSVVERHLVELVHTEAARAFVRGTLETSDRVVSTGVQRIVPGQLVTLVAP